MKKEKMKKLILKENLKIAIKVYVKSPVSGLFLL